MMNDPINLVSRVVNDINEHCGNKEKLRALMDELFNELQDLLIDMGDLGLNSELFKAYLAAYAVVGRIIGDFPQPAQDSLTDELLRLIHGAEARGLEQYDVSAAVKDMLGRIRCGNSQ
ncbi:hypothetical protein GCM10007981_05390 [Thermocladium modestius]|uniref:Uncharacterized protein n=1 Tax=Thermocladium modestius TaxID=62609 RepID=A0A830GUN0_9CREN|nr:hypothetical protein [Thermocladium modestius]GGP19888.1 hypothetical protein GCM10007981_05390 [Thermocladium modestius]